MGKRKDAPSHVEIEGKRRKMPKKIVYHDTCPKCNRKMQQIDKHKKSLFYYCKNCKQKYRIYVAHQSQIVDCPHCNKKVRLTKKIISELYLASVFNFEIKKIKV